jgi:DNA-binding GntR family transcriptional regulator
MVDHAAAGDRGCRKPQSPCLRGSQADLRRRPARDAERAAAAMQRHMDNAYASISRMSTPRC